MRSNCSTWRLSFALAMPSCLSRSSTYVQRFPRGMCSRLRGPKKRYTRHGLLRFERLRIGAPGYDKMIRAVAPGLADGFSAEFGVIPNGIPRFLRFASSPTSPVMSDAIMSGSASVTVELLDIYQKRVTNPPSLTLAPFLANSSHVSIAAICDAICRDNAFVATLRHTSLDAPDNPHLRGGSTTTIEMQGGAVLAVNGLARFSLLKLTLPPQGLSTRVQLRVELVAEREVTQLDENGTATVSLESYAALAPATAPAFGVMRPVDPVSLSVCQSPRTDDDHNAGVCKPYSPGLVIRARQTFPGPLVLFLNLNASEVLVVPDQYGILPFAAAAVVRASVVAADGSDLEESVLKGIGVVSSEFYRSAQPFSTPRQIVNMAKDGRQGEYYIDKAGQYRFSVTSFGLIDATSDVFTIVGSDASQLSIDSVPVDSQAYGELLAGPTAAGSEGRLLSVGLYDTYGNSNASSGIAVSLELSGLARFLDRGWLVTKLERTTVDGVADFSDATITAPPAFQDTDTILQALLVDGEGPDQAGWGMDADRVAVPGDSVVLELKGIGELGDIVLMKSDNFDDSLCADAASFDYQAGDYAHPPGSSQPLTHLKYFYSITGVTETPNGPIANLTLLPPITLSNAQTRQRDREEWPHPSPLEVGAYGICFKRSGSNAWKPQLGNRCSSPLNSWTLLRPLRRFRC